MKTSQLMLGDLVMFEGKPYKVIGIDNYNSCNVALDMGKKWYDEETCDASFVEPIPLTEEILEANGWTLLANFCGEAYWSENGEFHIPYNKGQYRIIIHGIVIKITYVHELQRVLRCCGLWELANNFKL